MQPIAGSFREVQQTSVALATESKIMKNVFGCYKGFIRVQLFFLLCVILYIRKVAETQDWGEKEIQKSRGGGGVRKV